MKKRSSVFYINIGLSAVAFLLIVNAFSPTGHNLIKRALAAVGAITGEGTLNYVARFAGAQSTSNFIGNSIIYDSGTNVGIGTASPQYKLSIAGGNQTLGYYSDATHNASIELYNSATANMNFQTTNASGGDFTFSGGNVGIGTTSPQQKLHIYNGASGATAYGNTYLTVENSARAAIQLLAPDVSDQYVFFGSSLNGAQAYVGYEGLTGGNGTLLHSSSGDVFFRAGGTDKMRIKASGNVGIGTTGPNKKLEISVGGTADYPLRLNSSSGYTIDIGALNSTYAHFDTNTTSGFYFYDNVTTPGNVYAAQFVGGGAGLTGIVATDSTKLAKAGDTMSGPIRRSAHAQGFFEGSYNNVGENSSKTNPIYTIGSNYNPTETTLAGMYGIGYAHANLWGSASNKPTEWGLYGANGGTFNFIAASDGIWTVGSYRGAVSGSSYGGIKISGTTGGYTGMYLANGGNTVVGMYDTAGNGGIWDPGYGWQQYWHRGNASLGIGSSTTSSSYKLYVSGNTYVSGSLYAAGGLEMGLQVITASCSTGGCTATATCSAGRKIIYGMNGDWYNSCYYAPNFCSGYCTPGATSCSRTSTGSQASVYAVCALIP